MTAPVQQRIVATGGTFLHNVLFGLAFGLGWSLKDWLVGVLQDILGHAH